MKGLVKKPISPAKLNVIKSIFDERLTSLQLKETEKNLREKRLNTLLGSAIINIQRKCNQNVKKLFIDASDEQAANVSSQTNELQL